MDLLQVELELINHSLSAGIWGCLADISRPWGKGIPSPREIRDVKHCFLSVRIRSSERRVRITSWVPVSIGRWLSFVPPCNVKPCTIEIIVSACMLPWGLSWSQYPWANNTSCTRTLRNVVVFVFLRWLVRNCWFCVESVSSNSTLVDHGPWNGGRDLIGSPSHFFWDLWLVSHCFLWDLFLFQSFYFFLEGRTNSCVFLNRRGHDGDPMLHSSFLFCGDLFLRATPWE